MLFVRGAEYAWLHPPPHVATVGLRQDTRLHSHCIDALSPRRRS